MSAARHFARSRLGGLPGVKLEAVELMVSELATNAVKHADTAFEVLIDRDGAYVRVEVTDTGAGEPTQRMPEPRDPTGRGLRIVELMADRWGVRRAGQAKTVWFLVEATPPPAGRSHAAGGAA